MANRATKVDSGFSDSSSGVVHLNRLLRSKLIALPELKDWTMLEIAATDRKFDFHYRNRI